MIALTLPRAVSINAACRKSLCSPVLSGWFGFDECETDPLDDFVAPLNA